MRCATSGSEYQESSIRFENLVHFQSIENKSKVELLKFCKSDFGDFENVSFPISDYTARRKLLDQHKDL